MIPLLWLRSFLGAYWVQLAIGLAAVLAVGLFSHVRYSAGDAHGRAAVQVLWDADKAAAREAYAKAEAATQAIVEADRRKVQERESALLKQVEVATTAGADLGRRMSNYQAALARCRSVPTAPRPAAGPDGPAAQSGDSGEIGRLAEEIRITNEQHFANCAADAVELAGWQAHYPALQANRSD